MIENCAVLEALYMGNYLVLKRAEGLANACHLLPVLLPSQGKQWGEPCSEALLYPWGSRSCCAFLQILSLIYIILLK